MGNVSGLGKMERKQLAAVLRETKGTISVGEVAGILKVSRNAAAKLLSKWMKKGWVYRIRRGIYISVPLESKTSDIPAEDPWIIAERLYRPCYIGGWSAVEYWDFTEQIFQTLLIFTTLKPRERVKKFGNMKFFVRAAQEKAMFGLNPIWRGQVKVNVSDPTRTVLDILADPQNAGGIRSGLDFFRSYLNSERKNLDLLIEYAIKLGNGSVFKRLGFLLERNFSENNNIIAKCRDLMTTGNAKLDPKLPADKLITRWRLWVPENWSEE